MIGSFVKWYRCSFDYAVYRMSYANIIMYGSVIPSFGKTKKDGKDTGGDEDVADMGNPDDWQRIKDFYRHKH